MMMRKNLWMLAAILVCVTMTMLTSCSENDNPVDDIITPTGKPKVFRLAQVHAVCSDGEQDWYSFLS